MNLGRGLYSKLSAEATGQLKSKLSKQVYVSLPVSIWGRLSVLLYNQLDVKLDGRLYFTYEKWRVDTHAY